MLRTQREKQVSKVNRKRENGMTENVGMKMLKTGREKQMNEENRKKENWMTKVGGDRQGCRQQEKKKTGD